jgi:membrane fusion protein (multidrug efflux system)
MAGKRAANAAGPGRTREADESMMARRWIGRIAAIVIVAAIVGAAALWWSRPVPPSAATAPPPAQVGVVQIVAADVALPLDFSGRVAGFRVVEIRSQVNGVLLKREYQEGSVVDVGQVLFRIDPRTYEAALARANAQAAQARATLIQAEENFKRQEGLAAQKVATQKAYEDAIAVRDQARAQVLSTEADVLTAKLNIEFTVIKAPVKGPTSLVSPPEGTLIKAQDTLLTTITQLDPAYVNFTFTDSELRRLQEIDKSPEELFDSKDVKVELQFGDGAVYPHAGRVDTRSRTVDPRTGTILTRAIFPNVDGALLPGQFVRVKMTGITMPKAIVVPKIAISQGPLGPFVYLIEKDNVARARPVRIYRELPNGYIVRKGLEAGDRIVVDGVIRVRAGSIVNPVPFKPAADAPTTAKQ